jgi:hypothetical protein
VIAGLPGVLADYNWGQYKRFVDIGGAHGSALAALMTQHPSVPGVLFDMPEVITRFAVLFHIAVLSLIHVLFDMPEVSLVHVLFHMPEVTPTPVLSDMPEAILTFAALFTCRT